MNKILTAGIAALTLVGTTAASVTPAAAQSYRYGYGGYGGYSGYRYHHRGDTTGAAIAGGLAGLALGAAIAGNHNDRYYGHRYYGGGYYGGGYYGGGYYSPGYYDDYGGGYAVCTGRRTIWDPYIGGYVVQRYNYAC